MRKLLGCLAIAWAICVSAAPSNACSIVVNPNETHAEKVSAVQREIESATAIIDGEVVRSADHGGVALLYAHRVLKGPDRHWFNVISGTGGDCRREFPQIGERARLFLYKVPEGLVADGGMYPRVEDQVLKSDRRKEFPYFAGPRQPTGIGSNQ